MIRALYLGWKYVVFHRWKAAMLVCAITLVLFLPPALVLVIDRGAEDLSARAAATPLLLGAPGSALEVTLSALYFSGRVPAELRLGDLEEIDPELAEALPLHVKFRARSHPIVGTTSAYLEFRNLTVASGRMFALLGECVIGANVARALKIGVGDAIVSSPESRFDLAGVYPLKMSVVGVLARSLTPDDDAVITDFKTAWVIEGFGHGHQDLAQAQSPDLVLARTETSVTANAAVVEYNEITDANRQSFHFHGASSDFPLTGAIVAPRDEKARAILLGRFLERTDLKLLRPDQVMRELLDTIFTVRAFVLLVIALVGVATITSAVLVLTLSLRLRAAELLTLQRMGASRAAILTLMGAETLFVTILSVSAAAVLLLLSSLIGTDALVAWIGR